MSKYDYRRKVHALIAMWRDVRLPEIARRAYANKAEEMIDAHDLTVIENTPGTRDQEIARFIEDVTAWRANLRREEDEAARRYNDQFKNM